MPREQINTPPWRIVMDPTAENKLPPGEFGIRMPDKRDEELREGEHIEPTPALHVGWHRQGDHGYGDDGCVQFHLEVAADEVLRAADAIRKYSDRFPSWTFSTMHLSRLEIQKSIKVMRRARDAAFGADE